MPASPGKIVGFVGAGNNSVVRLNAIRGLVTLAGDHGVTITPNSPAAGTITIDTPQDLQVSASPGFQGVTSAHFLKAQTSGSENYGIASLVEQPVAGVDGPRIGFHRALTAGDKYWSLGLQNGADNARLGIYEDNVPSGAGAQYGALRIGVEQSGGAADPVLVDGIGGVAVGSITHAGPGFSAVTLGAFNNSTDHSAMTGCLGVGDALTLLQRFNGGTSALRREDGLVVATISPLADTNWETGGVFSMAASLGAPLWSSGATYGSGDIVTFGSALYTSLASGNTNHNPPSSPTWWATRQRPAVVAGTFFGAAFGPGATVWALNPHVKDYDHNDTTQHFPATITIAECDVVCADTGSTVAGITLNLTCPNGQPTNATKGFTLQNNGGYYDYGFNSEDNAAVTGLALGRSGNGSGNSQVAQFTSGSTPYFAQIYSDTTGALNIHTDVVHNSNTVKIDATGSLTVPNNLTVGGAFSFSVNVNRYRPTTGSPVLRTVNRTVAAKLAESTSIADFGVVGSSLASPLDEAAAVQEAFNTMAANGGWLRIPAGMYIFVSAQIVVPSGLRVIGDGANLCGFYRYNLANANGMFYLAPGTSNVEMIGFLIDGRTGDNLTGALQATARINYSTYSDPSDSQWLNYSTITIAQNCSNLRFEDLQISHTGGYAIYGLAAFSGNISDVFIRHCTFFNNRPHIAGPTGDINYGTWGGGVMLEFNGSDAFYQNIHVESCTWKRCTGNCFWLHAQSVSNPAYFSREIYFQGNYAEDIGLDFTQPAGVDGYVETDNSVRRFGYVVLDDAGSTRTPRWNVIPVAFDTAGVLLNAVRSNNYAEGNGEMFDLDGCGESTVSNNVFISAFETTDPLAGSSGTLGPHNLLGQNWTRGVVSSNSNGVANVGSHMIFEGNEFYGCGGGAFGCYGLQHSKIIGNLIYYPNPYQAAPITLGNLPGFHALDNDVMHNTCHGSTGSSSGMMVFEDAVTYSTAFSLVDINRVRGNVFTSTVFYEFLKDNNSSSTTDFLVVSSTSSQAAGIVETRFLTQGTNPATHQLQIWSNFGSGNLNNTQMMTITNAATFVPALGIGASGIIDAARNVGPCNSLTISKSLAGAVGPILQLVNSGGSGQGAIDAYTYGGQTVPTTRYLFADTGGFNGDHVFYTATGGSPNTPLVERFRIKAGGDLNWNGALYHNGGLVIDGSGNWVGNISASIVNATSAFELGGVVVIDGSRNGLFSNCLAGGVATSFASGGSSAGWMNSQNGYLVNGIAVINGSQQGNLSALTVGGGGATFNSAAFFNFAGNYSISASSINVTTLTINGGLFADSSRNLWNIGSISASGNVACAGVSSSNNIATTGGAAVFVCQGSRGSTQSFTDSTGHTWSFVGGLLISRT